jgi:aminoglycoside 3'-phosphotransferase-2
VLPGSAAGARRARCASKPSRDPATALARGAAYIRYDARPPREPAEPIVSLPPFDPNRVGLPTDVAADLPPAWQARLAGATFTRQTIGCSDAAVFRVERAGGETLFVKTEPLAPLGELPGEATRLRWLGAQGVPCPAVLDEARGARRHWLLTSALPGRDLASSPGLSAQAVVDLAADALRALHGLDPAACPFDHRSARRIAAARARLDAGLVDASDFDDERAGRSARDAFAELLATRPGHEDLVVTHGDACLPNLIAADGRFGGFVDCGRLGVADRHQDLALAARSIGDGLGEVWVDAFFRRYGGAIDPGRLAFYRLLDEFF